MKVLFAVLLVLEVALLACALQILPWIRHADTATVLFAGNLITLIVVGKRMQKKRACCS